MSQRFADLRGVISSMETILHALMGLLLPGGPEGSVHAETFTQLDSPRKIGLHRNLQGCAHVARLETK